MVPVGGLAGAHLVFDALTDAGIHVLPVREGTLQHGAAHAAEQAAGYLVDELGALGVVPDLAYQGAGLTEVVVVSVQAVGAAHHLAVGFPTVVNRTGLIGVIAAEGVRSRHRSSA